MSVDLEDPIIAAPSSPCIAAERRQKTEILHSVGVVSPISTNDIHRKISSKQENWGEGQRGGA